VKRTYSEPHWSKKRAAVMAFERVTLYGVPLVADRPVNYGHRPALARELFIRHALVYGEWPRGTGSTRATCGCCRRRRSSSTAPGGATSSWTSTPCSTSTTPRVGAEVVSGAHFDQWWKQTRREQPELLTFDPAMLTHDTAGADPEADYPRRGSRGRARGLTFPISYHFEPGAADDGLTIDVPVATLNRVAADDFSWNVPGLREELVTGLIRSLPKHLRVNFVPAPNRAREFLAAVPAGEEPLLDALERYFRSTTGVVVPREAWDWAKVPEHLRPTYRVVDDDGPRAGPRQGPRGAKEPLRPQFAQAIAEVAADSGITAHRRDRLGLRHRRASFTQKRAGHEVRGFPASSTRARRSGCRSSGRESEQEAQHRLGVRRLLLLTTPSPVKRVLDGLDNAEKLGLAGRRTQRGASCSRTAGPRSSARSSTPARRCATQAAYAALRTRRPPTRRRTCARCGRRAPRPRRLAQAEKALSGRADMLDAAGAVRHEGAARAAGAPRLRRRGRDDPAAALPDVPRRRSSTGASGSTRHQPRPAADGPDRRAPGGLPAPGGGAPGGRPPGSTCAGALDARGVPPLAVGPAPRHGYPVSDQRIRKALQG
jgi:ATP-dependent helicase HrpA